MGLVAAVTGSAAVTMGSVGMAVLEAEQQAEAPVAAAVGLVGVSKVGKDTPAAQNALHSAHGRHQPAG